MSTVFLLTGPRKGQSITFLNRYRFDQGVMIVSDEDADKMSAMMEFYAAKRVSLEEYETARAKIQAAESTPSEVTKTVVKPGKS
jgi:hypothetical protein